MLVFIIPLKSKQASKSWSRVSELIQRTLQSVCNQTCEHFRVIVVCNDLPEVKFQHPSIEYIEVNFSLIKEDNRIVVGLTDKGRKILRGITEAQKFNPSHIMAVDADDCVSRRLAQFVKDNPNNFGWYFHQGYKYLEGENYIYFKRSDFYTLSGTAHILNYHCLEIPENPEYNRGYGYYKFYLDHSKIPAKMKNKGFPMQPLPFSGGIYNLGTSENMSGNERFLKFNWLNRRSLTKKVQEEFNLYPLFSCQED